MSERTDCSHKNLDKLAQQLLNLHLSYDKEMSQAATVLSSSGEYGVLYCLNQHCSCYSAGELAETLGLSSGRIANVLTTLERKNLITRKRDHLDGRKTMVSLTEEGKQ